MGCLTLDRKLLNDYAKQYFNRQYADEYRKFSHIIRNMFSDHEIIENFNVPGSEHVLDWYVPVLKLAIEIDNYEKLTDRRFKIEKILNCKFAVYNPTINVKRRI